MFFPLSKILWFLLAPSNLLPLLIALGLVLGSFSQLRRTGLALAGLACAALITLGQ